MPTWNVSINASWPSYYKFILSFQAKRHVYVFFAVSINIFDFDLILKLKLDRWFFAKSRQVVNTPRP